MMDLMMLDSNEHGEMVTMPEQADAIVGKAINLVHLQRTPNAEKKVALFFWNHPPGEKNQGRPISTFRAASSHSLSG